MPEPKAARINIEYPHMDKISDAMYGALISRLHTAQIPFDVLSPGISGEENSMDLFFYETDLDAAQKALEPCMLVEVSRDAHLLRFLRPQMPLESTDEPYYDPNYDPKTGKWDDGEKVVQVEPPIQFCNDCGVSSDVRIIYECECGLTLCSSHYDGHHCDFRN